MATWDVLRFRKTASTMSALLLIADYSTDFKDCCLQENACCFILPATCHRVTVLSPCASVYLQQLAMKASTEEQKFK